MSDAVTDAVVATAENVPHDLVLLGAAAIESAPCWSPDAQHKLLQASPASHYRPHAERIGRSWAAVPNLPGSAVAAALRAASTAVQSCRTVNRLSLVWTGPATSAIGLRSTRAVIHTIVENAAESLTLVSFAGYRVDDLVAALARAADRGVEISLILETHDDSRGGLTVDAANAFAGIRGHARFYRWPVEARRAYFAETARLHAKCIVADRSVAFITSANLTSAGINDNIELGTLIEAGPLPALLHDHLQLLIENDTLQLVE